MTPSRLARWLRARSVATRIVALCLGVVLALWAFIGAAYVYGWLALTWGHVDWLRVGQVVGGAVLLLVACAAFWLWRLARDVDAMTDGRRDR